MKHLSTLIAVKNLTIIQFTKIIQDLFYLDEFILDSLIIHLENCTIYHDESAIAFCIQYQNNDYEYIFNETKQNIYLSINKRNNQFIDLITYLNKYHFLNNNHFSYIQPNIKNMNDLNQVIEFIENKTILPVIYLNISLKDFKNGIPPILLWFNVSSCISFRSISIHGSIGKLPFSTDSTKRLYAFCSFLER